MEKQTSQWLNLQSTPEDDLRAAFDLLEGDGFYDQSSASRSIYGIGRAREFLAERQERYTAPVEGEEGEPMDDEISGAEIYGDGGFHRYFVLMDGTIAYSVMHGPEEADDAEALGFRLWGSRVR